MLALRDVELPGLRRVARGKVREIFDAGEHLLFVASDRISAFDVVLEQAVPDKGKVLHQLSRFWFERFAGRVPHHLVSDRVEDFPEPARAHRELLEGRAALVRRAEMLPVECVVRGYLAGSGLKEYRREGRVCGIELPPGLVEASQLPEPIFTPATKAESGHDENISFERMVEIVGERTARRLRELTVELYLDASSYAAERGIIIADTKLEFGLVEGELTLCDEVLTPDSSRFWPAASYEPGRPQPSFDKQYVRDFLEAQPWDKTPPAPALSEAVVAGTRERYLEALRILTGRGLD